jgi:small ligand-binding sensory domain FIST
LLRDATAADEDLSELLAKLGESGGSKGALLFSCNGRGRAMFPSADHDVVAVRQTLGLDAVAGFFAAGEIGPVAGRTAGRSAHDWVAEKAAATSIGDGTNLVIGLRLSCAPSWPRRPQSPRCPS